MAEEADQGGGEDNVFSSREEVEQALNNQLLAIEAKWDPQTGEITRTALCELLGVELTNQYEVEYRGPDKTLRGVAALEAALVNYNNQMWYKCRYLAQYDGELATNVHFGGQVHRAPL